MSNLILNDIEKDNVKTRAMGCKIIDYKVYKHAERASSLNIFLIFFISGFVSFMLGVVAAIR